MKTSFQKLTSHSFIVYEQIITVCFSSKCEKTFATLPLGKRIAEITTLVSTKTLNVATLIL